MTGDLRFRIRDAEGGLLAEYIFDEEPIPRLRMENLDFSAGISPGDRTTILESLRPEFDSLVSGGTEYADRITSEDPEYWVYLLTWLRRNLPEHGLKFGMSPDLRTAYRRAMQVIAGYELG